MAENHYVDPKDQQEAATGVDDHSELTAFYTEVKKEPLGPWMQEDARQAHMKDERDNVQKGLRKSSVLIGLSISLPLVLGILFGQYTMIKVIQAGPGPIIFILIIAGLLLLALVFILFRYVFTTFRRYSIRALPITITTLGSLFLVTQRIFNFTNGLIGGLQGYAVGLLSLIAVGIVIAAVSIFAWTSPKVHPLIKIFILIVILAIAVGVGFFV